MSQPPEVVWTEDEDAPLHGFHGDRALAVPSAAPGGLTIALSREAGARGGTIARVVGRQLGWAVYDQDHLEFLAGDPVARANLLDDLSPACVQWFEARLAEIQQKVNLDDNESLRHLIRLIVALATRGEVVILGRGAGYLLPSETTLNIRIIAPLEQRVAYMSQWLRLPAAEAAEKVHARDAERSEFVRRELGQGPADMHQYDLILNTSRFGEEACAALIAEAARRRWQAWSR